MTLKKTVFKYRGSEHDAKDVFQDAVLAIIRNINEQKLEGTDIMFQTYLLSICKYTWFNQLRTHEKEVLKEEDYADDYGFDEELMRSVEETTERRIFQDNFKKLDEICQKILKYHLKKLPDKKIAGKVKISDIKYLKKRKHLCKEKLIRMIKEDPKYRIYLKDKNI